MDPKPPIPDETLALRRCVRELAALSTLSAVWSGSDVPEIAEGLCRVLARALPAALVHVRVRGPGETVALEMAGTQQGPIPSDQAQAIGKALEPLLTAADRDPVPTVAHPLGGG